MRGFFKYIVVAVLTWEARRMLRTHRPFIIAVTGSVGKTTTKDAIFHILKDTASVRKSEKSFNSELGVPLAILGLPNAWYSFFGWIANLATGFWRMLTGREYPQILVLEVGADHPGDIKRLTRWLIPDIVVLTRLPDRPAHVEHFSSPSEVRKEKAALADAIKEKGVFIGCADDPHIMELIAMSRARPLLFGFHSEANVRCVSMEIIYENANGVPFPAGTSFTVSYLGERATVMLRGVLGTPAVLAILAAFAVGIAKEVPLARMAKALTTFETPPGRMRIVQGKNNTVLIDDSYNASPVAGEEALLTLRHVSGWRKIAMLGDMRELGPFEEEEHKKLGRLAGSFVHLLITVGKRARWIGESAREAGLPEKNVHEFADSETAGKWMAENCAPGDVILLKGSQGKGEDMIRIERAVKLLMAHPEEASKLLVRQEKAWQRQ